MSQFEKPKSKRFLQKIATLFTGLVVIFLPIATLIWVLVPSDDSILPSEPLISSDRPASFANIAEWSGNGNYAILDHHTHTTVSDGVLTQQELAELAVNSQCDAVVFADHSDVSGVIGAARYEQIDAIRAQYPDLLLFAGLEINIASYNGREHLTLITHPDQERQMLNTVRVIAEKENDDSERKDPTRDLDKPFFDSINLYNRNGVSSVVLYNHPSRMDVTKTENKADLIAWHNWSPHFIGFAGAPGHQNTEPHGLYEQEIKTVNRWDHIAADVGGVWDQLLSEGYQSWGAIAGSDFHDRRFDFAPCTFSRTHVEVEERTHTGILNALRAGTFWADHGRILNQLNLTAMVDGLERPARPGSVVDLGSDKTIDLNIAINRGVGSFGKPVTVDFISNCGTGRPVVVASNVIAEEEYQTSHRMLARSPGLDRESCYVRTIIKVDDRTGTLMAMTNPIRFQY